VLAGNANELEAVTTLVPNNGGRVDWSEGTNQIVYSKLTSVRGSAGSGEIYVMNPDGSGQVCLTCDKPQIPHAYNDQPAWRPQGDALLFQSADPTLPLPGVAPDQVTTYIQGGFGYNNNLWISNPDGSSFTQLTHLVGGEATLHPHFSPDGTRIMWSAFEPRRLGGSGWVLKLGDYGTDSGQPALTNVQSLTPLGTNGMQVYESHDISADNGTLLYSYSQGQPLDLDIYKTNIATGVSTNLTNAPGVWDEHAHFSPDGQRIAWVSSRGFDFTPSANWEQTLRTEVWLMNADGSDPQQVTFWNTPGQTGAPGGRVIAADLAWNPDGTSLVVARSVVGKQTTEVVRVDLKSIVE
jgi:Tol biopolymer transport system component